MVRLFFLLLTSAFTTCAFSATVIASHPTADCPNAPRAGEYGQVRIPLGQAVSPPEPWVRPFKQDCLSWSGIKAKRVPDKKKSSFCDTFTVDKESKYYVVISTHEAHRDVRNTKKKHLFSESPSAIVRLSKDNKFMQREEYYGDHFQTSQVLRPDHEYEICIWGFNKSFTMCTLNLIACNSSNPQNCDIPEKNKVAEFYQHTRSYSDRKC